jgi:hypothetical protein
MDSKCFQLLSPLTPTECASRLTAAIDTGGLFSFDALFGSKPVIGRVTESSIRLRKRIPDYIPIKDRKPFKGYNNPFQTFLTATMRHEPGGTVISGKLAMDPPVRIFMFVWFAGVILIGGTIFLATISSLISGSGGHPQNQWPGVVIPPLMLGFGYGFIRLGRYLARDEARFLVDFLIKKLDAQEQK